MILLYFVYWISLMIIYLATGYRFAVGLLAYLEIRDNYMGNDEAAEFNRLRLKRTVVFDGVWVALATIHMFTPMYLQELSRTAVITSSASVTLLSAYYEIIANKNKNSNV